MTGIGRRRSARAKPPITRIAVTRGFCPGWQRANPALKLQRGTPAAVVPTAARNNQRAKVDLAGFSSPPDDRC